MAKRKKRVRAHHPEEFEQLDEELTRALDNLAQRNRATERSLDELAPEKTADLPEDNSSESADHPAHDEEET
jgi:hypothetical protein